MENSIDVGLGTGLSAQLNDAATLGRMNMQADLNRQKIGAEKAQRDEEEYRKTMEDFALNGKFKQHRLVVDEAMRLSVEAKDAAMEARNSGDPNWKNKLWDIRTTYNTKMAELTAKSMRFAEIDKMLTPAAERTMYVAPEVREFQNIYNTASTYKDLVEKTRAKGIESPYVAVADTGDVHLYMPPKIALQAQIMKTGSSLPNFSQRFEVTDKNGGKVTEESLLPFVTIKDAEAYALAKGLRDTPASIEASADQTLAYEDFREQYAAVRNIPFEDTEKLKKTLMEEMAQYTRARSAQRFYLQRVNNNYVNVNTGLEVGSQTNRIVEGDQYKIASHPTAKIKTEYEYNVAVSPKSVQLGASTMNASTWEAGQPKNTITKPLIQKLVVLPSDVAGLPLRINEEGKFMSNGVKSNYYSLKPTYRVFYYITDETGLNGYYIEKTKYVPGVGDFEGGTKVLEAVEKGVEELQKKADELNKGK